MYIQYIYTAGQPLWMGVLSVLPSDLKLKVIQKVHPSTEVEHTYLSGFQ